MAVTKADLANAVYQRHGALSRRESLDLVEAILTGVQRTLVSGEPVKISGFGSFAVVQRKSRKARNPRTGAPVMIPERRYPLFRPSREIIRRLNHPGSGEPLKTEAKHGT